MKTLFVVLVGIALSIITNVISNLIVPQTSREKRLAFSAFVGLVALSLAIAIWPESPTIPAQEVVTADPNDLLLTAVEVTSTESKPSYLADFDKNAHSWDVGPASYISSYSQVPSQTVNQVVSENEYRVTLTTVEKYGGVWPIWPRYDKALGFDELQNFVLEVDMKIITGPNTTESIGIFFRSAPNKGYAAFISPPSGTGQAYTLRYPAPNDMWVNDKLFASIDRSKFNRFRIEAIDSQIKIFINGDLLVDRVDTTYSRGGIRVGLWVPGGTSATYAIDNFKLWKLD